ncbi:VpaChn25_0724 family phage protein [Xanthobacter flavus]|uniref:VpaChn25_0724 family phage protein n=1 Tax=Xanthobacter flavus TaxID=281 RepID=UPI00372B9F22
MSMDRIIREEARLIILKALAEQSDATLNSELLRLNLERYGISRPRAWVHGELDYLVEMAAVTLTEAGTVKVAMLTDKGQRHVERKLVIEGVKRPSLPGG